jgi:histone H3/H4
MSDSEYRSEFYAGGSSNDDDDSDGSTDSDTDREMYARPKQKKNESSATSSGKKKQTMKQRRGLITKINKEIKSKKPILHATPLKKLMKKFLPGGGKSSEGVERISRDALYIIRELCEHHLVSIATNANKINMEKVPKCFTLLAKVVCTAGEIMEQCHPGSGTKWEEFHQTGLSVDMNKRAKSILSENGVKRLGRRGGAIRTGSDVCIPMRSLMVHYIQEVMQKALHFAEQARVKTITADHIMRAVEIRFGRKFYNSMGKGMSYGKKPSASELARRPSTRAHAAVEPQSAPAGANKPRTPAQATKTRTPAQAKKTRTPAQAKKTRTPASAKPHVVSKPMATRRRPVVSNSPTY